MREQENNIELDELAAEYVLGTLEGDDRLLFQQRIKGDPEAAEAVQQWENRLAPMLDAVSEVTPPEDVWSGIEQRLGFDEEKKASFWNSLRLWQGFSAVATAVGLVLALVLINTIPVSPEMFYMVQDNDRTEWVVRANHQESMVAMQAVDPPQLPEGKVCQLWVTTSDGLIHPLGVLPHDGTVTFPVVNQRDQLFSQDAEISVTIEDQMDGYESMPTGPVVSRGKWIRI